MKTLTFANCFRISGLHENDIIEKLNQLNYTLNERELKTNLGKSLLLAE